MAWLVLALGVTGLVLAVHAWRPLRAPSPVALVSFFLSWLTTELAIHHVIWQVAVIAVAVYTRAILTWPGAAGVVCSLAACVALAQLHRRGARAEDVIARALEQEIGAGYVERLAPAVRPWVGSAFSWKKILLPFSLGHADVETIRDVPFARVGGLNLELDVHRPRVRPGGAPTLVYVHGGGWVVGFRERQGLPLMRHLAARGWVCFSVDYRLSPHATFPDHLIDVKRALAWVREHATEHGGNPDFLVVCGNSAGAHLASLAALTPNERRYQPGFEDVDTSVSGCVGLYGVYDFTDRHGHWPHGGFLRLLERIVMKKPRATAGAAYAEASPIERADDRAPPFFLAHGDRDTLAPTEESRRFSAALRAKSAGPVVYAEIPDAQHAFEIFSSPRAFHLVSGVTSFLAYLYSGYLEARAKQDAAAADRTRSGFVRKVDAGDAPSSLASGGGA